MAERTGRVRAQIALANSNRYSGGREVENYLDDGYHSLRLTLAARLLEHELRLRNPEGSQPKILELAAAKGEASQQLTKLGCRSIASDRDHIGLRSAIERGLPAVQLDAGEPFPFGDCTIDGVLAGEILEHLFDPVALLKESRRILRPRGILVLTTPNLATAQDRLRFVFGKAPRQVNPLHEYLYLHVRPLTYELVCRLLREAKFRPRKLESNFVVWRTSNARYSNRTLAKLFPGLGGSLIVSAEPVDT